MLCRAKWIAAAVVLVGAFVPQTAPAQNEQTRTSEVRTSATAQRTVRPDLATVRLAFTADGSTPVEAGRALSGRADSLRRSLGALGIPKDSLITASRWYWWNGRIQSVPGTRCVPLPERTPDGRTCMMVNDTTYRAHDAIEVHIWDLTKVGAVLDTAMAHGITDISNLQFRATDVAAAQEEALEEATTKARRQAETIARADGVQLGRVLSLSTQGEGGSRYPDIYATTASADSGPRDFARGTTVVQPSIPVSVTVYGRWELVAKP